MGLTAALARRVWCETRARLALAAGALAAACAAAVASHDGAVPYAAHLRATAYGDGVTVVFAMLAIALGGGTLRQEYALGTAGFTLALPVTRARLAAVRAVVGLAEVAALAAAAAVVLAAGSALAGEHHPPALALRYAVLWAACGAALFALAVLASTVIASEYVAWLCAFAALVGYQALLPVTPLRGAPGIDLLRLMAGGPWDGDARTAGAVALPGAALAGLAAVTAGLLGLAHLLARRQER